MKILDDLLSTLKQDSIVKDVRQGSFQTAVVTRYCGLASTPQNLEYRHVTPQVIEAGTLIGKRALELTEMVYSLRPLEVAIGMATINSLLEVDERRCVDLNARYLLAEKGKGRKVDLIGHFPFVAELRRAVTELWVIEQHPQEGDFPQDQAENLVPQADVVGITGAAFTNHTIEHLLSLCRPEAYVIILGSTAPLSPILFNYGVDAISGTKVVDVEATLRCISQGAIFRQIKGLRRLTMKK
ncbi:Rossmann-like domain-containing protein [Chloroflexota bacterium]